MTEWESLLASVTAKAQKQAEETSGKTQNQVASQWTGFAAKAKIAVVKGLLARDLLFGLVFFGVIATLTGATIALADRFDPATAAVTMGLTVLGLLLVGAFIASRKAQK